ncbi:unnamed protein product [Mytilus coruscus]|uniref:Uncharacterized protein n=1 Tax=Mytilus coruscus TaxID=42192 RepID=A0A6J8A696_MYTCO|nr:unnamed protein product [Mytilus coruscus]
MCLHKNKNVSKEMILKDITRKSMLAIDVFDLSIMALKNHLMSYLETQGTGVESRDIRWVLTVPAIWTENAKYFMRESAEKAIHDNKHLKFIDGVWRCRHAFDKIVEKDTVIPIGATIQRLYKPRKDYSKTWFKIYASENYNPVHTTEDGCSFLGKVAIDLSNSASRQGLEVEFTFGNTENGFTAIETETGIKCNAQFALI